MDTNKELLEKYQIRKTRKQKDEFIKFAYRQCEEAGYKCSLNENRQGFKSRNIIAGDIENAKVIFTAHYDTCARLLLPNLITPTNPILIIILQIFLALPYIIAVFAVSFFCGLLYSNVQFENAVVDMLFVFAVIILEFAAVFGIVATMLIGPANKHTANDNTSGVATLFELMRRLPEKERSKAAFVFFDHEELGMIGSSYFKKSFGKKLDDKLIINYDCVSDGNNFLFACKKGAQQHPYYEKLFYCFNEHLKESADRVIFTKKAIYPSDQLMFKCGIGVAALNKNIFGLYLGRIHTGRDVIFKEENITRLAQCGEMFVRSIE